MKKNHIVLLLASLLLIVFSTCKKDTEPPKDKFRIVKEREKVEIGITTANITGIYEYPGAINSISVEVGTSEHLFGSDLFVADVDGTAYGVYITGLNPGTLYHYRYRVDYGSKDDFLSEIYDFTTLSESPTVQTLDVMALDSTTFRVKCEVLSGGGQEVAERGILWSFYPDPTMDDHVMKHEQSGLGVYTIRMENLAVNTTYHVRAYAKNSAGTGFGEEMEFRTGSATTLPQVSTVEISHVTATTATCLGNVSSDGGSEVTERGVCWSLQAEPTTNDGHASSGAGLGSFMVDMTGLAPNQTYHVRAYATNEKGTAYGEELTFETTEGLPTVTTTNVTNITPTSATGGGEVTDQGASAVTERGICWSTSHNPQISDNHAANGSGLGNYIVQMTGLTPNQTYYVRAYATNAQGTAYGAEVEFSAQEGLPEVTTLEVTDITATTAKGHGNVTNQGASPVTERGLCWSLNPSPTVSDSYAHSGTGAGEYEISLTNLTPGTTYYVRAYAKNAQGETYGNEISFITEATLPTVTTGGMEGTTATGTVTNDGGATVTERGICWSTEHSPTTANAHGSNGTGTGTYTVELTDLAPGTTYYYRAYATNSKGTAYGDEKSFTTPANLPTVTTSQVSNITQTTAQGGGNVTDDGGATVTERGLCWSTSHNPTVSGSHAQAAQGGTGSFTVNLTGLTANTKYYVRAYAKNSAGIAYGDEVYFTTSQNISAPTVTTSQVTNIQQTSATGGGNVTADGGATVTERGICWSTNHNPTTNGSHATSGTGTGTYTVSMTGLTAGTTYYVRAYAINSQGTSYGGEVSFTTLSNGGNAPMGAIDGLFTINSNGDQVYFSKGNLQYIGSASTPYWKFADNQWECLGNNGQGSTSQNVDRDLFGWGTSNWNNGNTYFHPWDTDNSDGSLYGPPGQYNLTGSYAHADWGVHNAIYNGGGQAGQWRTLTGGNSSNPNNEWNYVFNTRNASTVNGVPNARYAKAKVANVQGVILFPDDYVHPSGVAQPTGINETGNAGWNGNNYTANDFGSMQEAGAVFLPAAGYRFGTSVNSVGSYGYYWSAADYNSNSARGVSFDDGYLDAGIYNIRYLGRSVRLVRSAQ